MKKLNVIVKDKYTLVLKENGEIDDYIDLKSLTSIDTNVIEKLIDDGKDQIYEKKLKEYSYIINLEKNQEIDEIKKGFVQKINELNNIIEIEQRKKENELNLLKIQLEADYKIKIDDLNNTIKNYEKLKESELTAKENEYKLLIQDYKSKYNDLESKKNLDIEKLNSRINSIEENQKIQLENEKLRLEAFYSKQIKDLNDKITDMELKTELSMKQKELDFTKAFDDMKASYEQKLQEKENAYLLLQRQKAALNIKQTGEDLETWCNREMLSYMQNGFANCTWKKDNDVVSDGDDKASKADFIFKVYASNDHKQEEELTSVCLDMKDENPDSVNKKTNEFYYKQLDKNRNKKNCKYAVLVSNLELDKPNDSPIFRVIEYPDMYVVRPAYMMTFLNLITSLTVRFQTLVLQGNKEKLELMNSIKLKEEFDDLKQRYLDKPLEQLATHLSIIREQGEGLRKISKKIEDECDFITKNYLNNIINKLDKFDIEIRRSYKRNKISD
ncbi:MAG: DUF2130 domain-containing protein [Anaeroplasma sp.]